MAMPIHEHGDPFYFIYLFIYFSQEVAWP